MKDESLDDFLVPHSNPKRTGKEVYLWWESQRWRYNKISFLIGSISIVGIIIIEKLAFEVIPYFIPVIFVVALLGNLCYFLGWFFELFTNRNEKVGPLLFNIGITFTIIVLLWPLLLVIYFKIK